MSGDPNRKRIPADAPVGTALAMSAWANIAFGAVFVVGGAAGILAATGFFGRAFEAGRGAPHWVFAAFGIFAAAMGCYVWAIAFRAIRAARRRETLARQNQTPAALLDYSWDDGGFRANPWRKAIRLLAWILVLSVFLSPFNYLVLGDAWRAISHFDRKDGVFAALGLFNFIPALIIAIFDGVLLWMLGLFVLAVFRAVRFGGSRLKWSRFPIPPGCEVELTFELPRTIVSFERADIDLRCIEEFWETSGHGDNRSRRLIHEQIWSERATFGREDCDPVTCALTARFSIPPEARVTSISIPPVVFWRADLRVAMAGPDYVATFLVPVYADEFPVANAPLRN